MRGQIEEGGQERPDRRERPCRPGARRVNATADEERPFFFLRPRSEKRVGYPHRRPEPLLVARDSEGDPGQSVSICHGLASGVTACV